MKLEVICGPMFCHRKGQEILLANGQLATVENLSIGSRLVGMDGKVRTVIKCHRGRGQMARIIPDRGGQPFVVTINHKLTLIDRPHRKNGKPSERGGRLVDISVEKWLEWPKWKKSMFKLFHVGVDKFPDATSEPLRIDPYFLGLLLGDGCIIKGVAVTTTDNEILDELRRQATIWNLRLVPDHITWHFSGTRGVQNPLQKELVVLGLLGTDSATKFIPQCYKTASKQQRLELLAGLIDTDGYQSRGSWQYTSKSRTLANDVAFIARSLGLSATVKEVKKRAQTGVWGNYYTVYIGGNTSIVPVRLPRKRGKQREDVAFSSFSVELLGEEEFFGVEVDGDHRYLMCDFLVTHNSGKTEELIRRIKRHVLAGREVQAFKPAMDHRYGVNRVTSHSKTDLEISTGVRPVAIKETDRLTIHDTTQVVAFDEVQFFSQDWILSVTDGLLKDGLRVICAGLDMNTYGEPFGSVPALLARADEITKLTAVCECGRDATRTFRAHPFPQNGVAVEVGGMDLYKPKCFLCWESTPKS